MNLKENTTVESKINRVIDYAATRDNPNWFQLVTDQNIFE